MFQLLLYQKKNDTEFLEQLKTGFKRTIKWSKYRSQLTIQPQNNNLNFLIDPTLITVNRLFVLSFAINAERDNKDSFSDYYVRNIKIKGFNVLIDGKSFFDLPVKNKKEVYEKIIDVSRNNDYTTGNLLDLLILKKITSLLQLI